MLFALMVRGRGATSFDIVVGGGFTMGEIPRWVRGEWGEKKEQVGWIDVV
jgi:hypothetical protein